MADKNLTRRSQISIYIAVGVVLLLIVGLAIYIIDGGKDEEAIINEDLIMLGSVSESVKTCFEDISRDVIYEVSSRSGYLYLPENSIKDETFEVSYYFDKGEVKIPKRFEVESDISAYISSLAETCLTDPIYEDVEFGRSDIDVILGDEDITISVKLLARSGQARFDSFNIKVDARLYHMMMIAEDIVLGIKEDPLWLDMTKLSGYDVKVDILPYSKDNFIFSLKDETGREDLYLLFAARFDTQKPILEMPERFEIIDDESFSYRIDTELELSEDSPMFDIENNWINFTPKVTGTFYVKIIGKDEMGFSEKNIEFIIKEGDLDEG